MTMRVALAQVSYDDEAGRSRAEFVEHVAGHVLGAVEGEAVDLVVLPELWSTGAFRPKQWRDRAEPLDGPTVTALAEVARAAGVVVHVGSVIERSGDGDLYNTAVVLGPDGGVLASYRKIHRFAAGGLEAELLSQGQDVCVVDLPMRNGTTVRTGLSTCYDLRFPELYRAQVDEGAALFVVPASWPAVRVDAWDLLLQARAVENQGLVVGVNAVGTDGRTPMGGRSVVRGPDGTQIASAGTTPQVLVVEADLGSVADTRADFPVLEGRRMTIAMPATTADGANVGP